MAKKDVLDKVLDRVAKRTKAARKGKLVSPVVTDEQTAQAYDPVRKAMLDATKPTQEK